MAVIIYGDSDDLVEIDGDIRQEFSSWEKTTLLAFDTGILIECRYGAGGIWRIAAIDGGGGTAVRRYLPGANDDLLASGITIPDHSESIVIAADVKWVLAGGDTELVKKKEST